MGRAGDDDNDDDDFPQLLDVPFVRRIENSPEWAVVRFPSFANNLADDLDVENEWLPGGDEPTAATTGTAGLLEDDGGSAMIPEIAQPSSAFRTSRPRFFTAQTLNGPNLLTKRIYRRRNESDAENIHSEVRAFYRIGSHLQGPIGELLGLGNDPPSPASHPEIGKSQIGS
jgi:hypothetical protein